VDDFNVLHFFAREAVWRYEQLMSRAWREEGAYTGCFHATSVLAILDFAGCGGCSKKSFSSFCLHTYVVDKHLTDDGVLFGEKFGRVGWIDFVVLLMNGELE
jgi:hypothetical protein